MHLSSLALSGGAARAVTVGWEGQSLESIFHLADDRSGSKLMTCSLSFSGQRLVKCCTLYS